MANRSPHGKPPTLHRKRPPSHRPSHRLSSIASILKPAPRGNYAQSRPYWRGWAGTRPGRCTRAHARTRERRRAHAHAHTYKMTPTTFRHLELLTPKTFQSEEIPRSNTNPMAMRAPKCSMNRGSNGWDSGSRSLESVKSRGVATFHRFWYFRVWCERVPCKRGPPHSAVVIPPRGDPPCLWGVRPPKKRYYRASVFPHSKIFAISPSIHFDLTLASSKLRQVHP